MYRIANYGIQVFRSQKAVTRKLQVTRSQTYGVIRHNSSSQSSGVGSTAFKGDVPLEKYLTTQLMTARKIRDTFRTNVLRVSGRMTVSEHRNDAVPNNKTVIGDIQTEQKLLSTQQGMSSEKLEQSALKSVRKAITKRKSTAAEYRSSNLADAAELEDQEAAFLETLLPKQLDREQLREAVVEIYNAAVKDGVVGADGSWDVPAILKIITERVEDAHGKGSVSQGDIASIVMPLLQRSGVLKRGTKSK